MPTNPPPQTHPAPSARRWGIRAAAALVAAIAWATFPSPAGAAVPGECRFEPPPAGGALGMTCVPAEGWNGELIVYAHGYVEPGGELDFHHLALPSGQRLPEVAQRMGYAFAATSYRHNGLVVAEGVEDLRELRRAFVEREQEPAAVHAIGVSEGGLIAALWAERHPQEVDGVLSACAPLDGMRRQIRHIGDFRVLFDFFFPRVLPGSPARVPTRVRAHWERKYRPRIEAAVRRQPRRALELMRVSRTPFPSRSGRVLGRISADVLWYSAFGTDDARRRLGGNPYGNTGRRYRGSRNDVRLNRGVRRLRSNPAARRALRGIETTGRLGVPLVALHTARDEIVPVTHLGAYAAKARRQGRRGRVELQTVARAGHCAFTAAELTGAFARLLQR